MTGVRIICLTAHDRGSEDRLILETDRGLKSGKRDFLDLTEDDCVRLATEALDALALLRHRRASRNARRSS